MIRSGRIENSETWSGEMLVKGDLLIPAGVSVTIMPGTTVFLEESKANKSVYSTDVLRDIAKGYWFSPFGIEEKCYLIVEGSMEAKGSEERKIVFKGDGKYGGIVLMTQEKAVLDHCVVKEAFFGALGIYRGDLYRITNSRIEHNIFGIAALGAMMIETNEITENSCGIYFKCCSALKNNTIRNNRKHGIICNTGCHYIGGNIISGNEEGFNLATCEECVIENNEISGHDVGIYSYEVGSLRVNGNRISNNKNTAVMSHLKNHRLEVNGNKMTGSKVLIESEELEEGLIDGNNFGDCDIALYSRRQLRTVVSNNRFEKVRVASLKYDDLSESTISKNVMTGVARGIIVSGESKLRIDSARISSANSSVECTDISSVDIRDSVLGSTNGAVLSLNKGSNVDLRGSILTGETGADSLDSSSLKAEGNTFNCSKVGIKAFGQAELRIVNNVIKPGRGEKATGIIASENSKLEMSGNTISSVREGLMIAGQAICKAEGVTVSAEGGSGEDGYYADNMARVEIRGGNIKGFKNGITAGGEATVSVTGCGISFTGTGINMKEQAVGEITDNDIKGNNGVNTAGINAKAFSMAKVSGNTISGVSVGINICEEAEIKHDNNRITATSDIRLEKAEPVVVENKRERSGGKKAKQILQRAVLASRGIAILRDIYGFVYRLAILAVKLAFRGVEGVGSLYLRRGMIYADWIPGASDIDLFIVIEEMRQEEELRCVKEIWRRYYAIKAVLPMLGEVHIGSGPELMNYLRWGDFRGFEAPATWRRLFGAKVEGEYKAERTKLKTDIMCDVMNSLRVMSGALFYGEKYVNGDELFTKAFLDIARYTGILESGKVVYNKRRADALRGAGEGLLLGKHGEAANKLEKFWVDNAKLGRDVVDEIFLCALEGANRAAGQLLDELKTGQGGGGVAGEGYSIRGRFNGDGANGGGAARTKQWETMCYEASRMLDGRLKGVLLENPGLLYLILDNDTIFDDEFLKNSRKAVGFIKQVSMAENTPCLFLTENMFNVLLRTTYKETPFSYFGLYGKGGPDFHASAGNERWQYNIVREDYGVPVHFSEDISLLIKETIAIISVSYRMFEGSGEWATRGRIVSYFNTILGLRLAVEKKMIVEPYIQSTLECYEREYPEEKAVVELVRKAAAGGPEEGLGDTGMKLYVEIGRIISGLIRAADGEVFDGSKEREYCFK